MGSGRHTLKRGGRGLVRDIESLSRLRSSILMHEEEEEGSATIVSTIDALIASLSALVPRRMALEKEKMEAEMARLAEQNLLSSMHSTEKGLQADRISKRFLRKYQEFERYHQRWESTLKKKVAAK